MTRPGVPEALAGWPGDLHCVFCNMLAAVDYAIAHGMPQAEAEAGSHILERGKACFLVLNAFPYNNGHLMVVPISMKRAWQRYRSNCNRNDATNASVRASAACRLSPPAG